MACNNYYRAKLILENNKKRWLKVNPDITEKSGIYVLYRNDENGINYAYVGQAKHLLTRLAQHLYEYPPQHIDLSLKKHKLYGENTVHGWKVHVFESENNLDELERYWIKRFADMGYQLRNKTIGGQNEGKQGIDDNKPSKGYHDGLKQGYENCLKDIRVFFDKYLKFSYKDDCYKKDGSVKEIYVKKIEEFASLMNGKDNGNG